mgnify:CR=1 FL=1
MRLGLSALGAGWLAGEERGTLGGRVAGCWRPVAVDFASAAVVRPIAIGLAAGRRRPIAVNFASCLYWLPAAVAVDFTARALW